MRAWIDFGILVRDLFAVDADGTVLDVFAGLTTGRFDLGVVNQPQDNVLLLIGNLNGWHVLEALFDLAGRQLSNVAGEQGCRDAFGFFNGLFTVHELGNLACQRLLGRALPWLGLDFFSQRVDFFLAQESEVLQVFNDVAVILIDPELVELVWRRLFRIQPDCAARCLTELGAVCFEHQRNRQTKSFGVGTLNLMNQINPGSNVAPLISPADLQVNVIMPVEMQEIDGLQDLVGKLSVGDPGFQTAGYDFLIQHRVHAEQLAVVAQEVDHAQFGQPVIVVDDGKVFRPEQLDHLVGQGLNVVLQL